MKQTFAITGMSCAACQMHVEKAVRALPGVEQADVNLLQNRLVIRYDEGKTSSQQIIQAVENAGYGAQEMIASSSVGADPLSQAAQLKRRFF